MQDRDGDPRLGGGTLAVGTGILGKATETGVRRHVALLFGGNTVVLCERKEKGHNALRPTFMQHPQSGLADRAEFEFGKLMSSLRYHSWGVPFGRRRRELEAFLREHRVIAILAEFGHIGANLAPIGQAIGIPVLVYFRGFDASKRLREPRVLRRYRAAMPRLAGVIAVSQFLLDNLAAHGITHPNSAVIPTGVDTSLFAPAEKDPHLVLAVGRIISKKAPLAIIDAFAVAVRDRPAHRLEIIGDGDMREAAEAHARSLGLAERVIFHGLKEHPFVREKLARAAIFLQHSVTAEDGNTEGLPTSIQEAMVSGCAVVSTRHAGIPEAIEEGVTGLLVDEHDVAGFGQALGSLLADPAQTAHLGAAAHAAGIERFDFEKLHARLEAMILAAAAGSH